ncbi:MAG: hypothetical protein WBI14_09240, partial [Anaerolineaceae bacterium]
LHIKEVPPVIASEARQSLSDSDEVSLSPTTYDLTPDSPLSDELPAMSYELVLADYYCIKCGACMQICPIKPEYKTETFEFLANSVTVTREREVLVNEDDLAVKVERWRVNHTPVSSASWTEALRKLSDDKAKMVEIDRKRALHREDLVLALRKGELSPDGAPNPNKGRIF